MAKDSERLEREFISTAREKTGKDIPEWMQVISTSGESKPNAILSWLKENHKLNHMQANFLSGIYLNDGKPVYDQQMLFAKLFDGKEHLRATYNALQENTLAQLSDTLFIPTKAYVSIEAKRCFACATLTKHNIRVGLDLGDLPFDDYTQKAKSLGAMPNLTHMVEITAPAEVNDKLLSFVKQAYANAHKQK
ncbi:MAG: DUF4287 domain-containing protein [Chloroflexi bacterium]|nr:DUF4287 domain-containing protein [Chloroflexota bacterium]MCC6895225.1 DUF4287 domain-containing protein [Anaerolineae bacterium]